jgi:thiazole synthase
MLAPRLSCRWAAPIGSGLGIRNPYNILILRESVRIPVIVDAGVGTASDAAIAMELGVDGVLMNTGIAGARDPVTMARAMRLAVEAGRWLFKRAASRRSSTPPRRARSMAASEPEIHRAEAELRELLSHSLCD